MHASLPRLLAHTLFLAPALAGLATAQVGPLAFDALADLEPSTLPQGSAPRGLTVVAGNTLYYSANVLGFGRSAYRWNVQDGLRRLAPPAPAQPVPSGPDGPDDFTAAWMGGELLVYFTAGQGTLANEVWVTDGTVAGTRAAVQPIDVLGMGDVGELVAVDQHLFFTAAIAPSGARALLRTDAISDTVTKLDTFVEGGLTVPFIGAHDVTAYLGGVAFATDTGDVLWSDGTPAGTRRLHAPHGTFDDVQGLYVHGGRLGFFVQGGSSPLLWEVYGADLTGAELLASYNSSVNGWVTPHFASIGDALYFPQRKAKVAQFVRTDLTAAGTVVAATHTPVPIDVERARSAFIGTTPVIVYQYEDANVAAFDGTTWMKLPALDVLATSGPETSVFLSGGYLRLDEAGTPGLVFEPYLTAGTSAWSQPGLDPLEGDGFLREPVLVDGRLALVLDDPTKAGEEVYTAPVQGAYVADLDFTASRYRITASDPILGQPIRISGLGAPAGAPSMLFLGGLLDEPTSAGMSAHTPLWLNLVSLQSVAVQTASSWSILAQVPASPSLAGRRVGLQAGYLDPLTNEVLATNALALYLGL